MSDINDMANDTAHKAVSATEQAIRAAAAQIPAGHVGECELCGEWSGRLVSHACAPCRDKYKLP